MDLPIKGQPSPELQKTVETSIPIPSGTLPSAVEGVNILKEEYKTLLFNSEPLDKAMGGVEEGLNILFGAPGTGKTNTCLHLVFNAIEKGMSVKYFDLERGVHKKRVLEIYNSRANPFPVEKLNNVFVRPKVWSWLAIVDDWYRTIRLDKPDLFIVDSVTPAFLKQFEGEREEEHWGTLKKRDLLAIDSHSTAVENKVIMILVAQESATKKDTTDIQSQSAVSFSGIGGRFAFMAKMWVYVTKKEIMTDKMTTNRYFILLKHRYLPDYSVTGLKIPFKITNRGVE